MNKFLFNKINLQRYENIAFVFLFMTILICPLTKINYEGKSKTENRNLAKIVNVHKLKHSEFLRLTKSFESWLNDRFRGRDKVISAYKKFDYALTGRIANDRAMMGKNGWLFYIDKNDGNSLFNFQNKSRFTDGQLVKIKNNIIHQKELLKAHGIDYYVFIAPDKNRIYGEYYPDYIHKVAQKGRAELLVEYLAMEGVKVIYPREELLKEKTKGYIYYPRGTHWNGYGAFIGYCKLMDEIKHEYKNLQIVTINDFKVENLDAGNVDSMSNWLQLSQNELMQYDNRILFLKKYNNWNFVTKKELKNMWGNDYMWNSNNYPLNDMDVIFLRDSFTTAMVPYLSESFANTYYFWTHDFNVVYPEILKIKPQIVVHEMVERYAPSLLIDVSKLKE